MVWPRSDHGLTTVQCYTHGSTHGTQYDTKYWYWMGKTIASKTIE